MRATYNERKVTFQNKTGSQETKLRSGVTEKNSSGLMTLLMTLSYLHINIPSISTR